MMSASPRVKLRSNKYPLKVFSFYHVAAKILSRKMHEDIFDMRNLSDEFKSENFQENIQTMNTIFVTSLVSRPRVYP